MNPTNPTRISDSTGPDLIDFFLTIRFLKILNWTDNSYTFGFIVSESFVRSGEQEKNFLEEN